MSSQQAYGMMAVIGLVAASLIAATSNVSYVSLRQRIDRRIEVKFSEVSESRGLYARDNGPDRIDQLERDVAEMKKNP